MTPAERIQPYIVACHRSRVGAAPLPDSLDDPVALFRGDPECLGYARTEIARLRQNGLRGVLAETDHESKIRCQTLEQMVAMYEEASA